MNRMLRTHTQADTYKQRRGQHCDSHTHTIFSLSLCSFSLAPPFSLSLSLSLSLAHTHTHKPSLSLSSTLLIYLPSPLSPHLPPPPPPLLQETGGMLAAAGVVGPTLALSALLCIVCSSGAYHRRLVLPGVFVRFFLCSPQAFTIKDWCLQLPPPPHSVFFFLPPPPLSRSPALPPDLCLLSVYLSLCM
jgi:hypothetical protein